MAGLHRWIENRGGDKHHNDLSRCHRRGHSHWNR
jgi:hypothetical protein